MQDVADPFRPRKALVRTPKQASPGRRRAGSETRSPAVSKQLAALASPSPSRIQKTGVSPSPLRRAVPRKMSPTGPGERAKVPATLTANQTAVMKQPQKQQRPVSVPRVPLAGTAPPASLCLAGTTAAAVRTPSPQPLARTLGMLHTQLLQHGLLDTAKAMRDEASAVLQIRLPAPPEPERDDDKENRAMASDAGDVLSKPSVIASPRKSRPSISSKRDKLAQAHKMRTSSPAVDGKTRRRTGVAVASTVDGKERGAVASAAGADKKSGAVTAAGKADNAVAHDHTAAGDSTTGGDDEDASKANDTVALPGAVPPCQAELLDPAAASYLTQSELDQLQHVRVAAPAMRAHTDALIMLTWLADQRLVSASWDNTLRIWQQDNDSRAWRCDRVIQGPRDLTAAVVLPGDERVAACTYSGDLAVVHLASGLVDGVWHAAQPRRYTQIAASRHVVLPPVGAEAGTVALAVGAAKGAGVDVLTLDAAQQAVLQRTLAMPEDARATIHSLAFGATGDFLLASAGTHVLMWNLRAGVLMHSLQAPGPRAYIDTVCFSPDSDLVVFANARNGRVLSWSTITGRVVAELAQHSNPRLPEGTASTLIHVSSDGVVAVPGGTTDLLMYHAGTGLPVVRIAADLPASTASPILATAWNHRALSSAKFCLATGLADGSILVWSS